MKVYLLWEGRDYEPDYLVSVHSTEQGANKALLERREHNQILETWEAPDRIFITEKELQQ